MKLGQMLGRGNTAEVFALEDREGWVLKRFFDFIPFENVQREYETTRFINQLRIPSPKVGHLVEVEGNWGIEFERVVGPSMTTALTPDPSNLKKMGVLFTELQESFHRKTADRLPEQKDYLKRCIQGTHLLSSQETDQILNYLDQLPIGDRICHGDYHPDNLSLVEDKAVVLDWMTATAGHPGADVARTLIILRYAVLPDSFPEAVKAQIEQVRNQFAEVYFETYRKLTHYLSEQIEQLFLPVMAARLVEGIPNVEKERLVQEIRKIL